MPVTKGITVNSRKRRNLESSFEDDFFNSDINSNDDESINNTRNDAKQNDPYYDSMLSIDDDIYCEFVESLDSACWQISPLELWEFNRTIIDNLTQDEIIRKINHEKIRYYFMSTCKL